MMIVRLKRNIGGPASRPLSRPFKRDRLGVNNVVLDVRPLTDNLAA